MADLHERHGDPVEALLDSTWRILAHEDLERLQPANVGKSPDRWLAAQVVQVRDRFDAEARRVVAARPSITARALADRLRAGPPPPNRTTPGFDRQAGLDHIAQLRARLQEGPDR